LRSFHQNAESKLAYPVLWFDTAARQAIAEAFQHVVEGQRYTCFACAILTDHAHVIIRKHRDRAETMIDEFKGESRQRLCALNYIPNEHPIWSDNRRNGFIQTVEHLLQAIRYVQENPEEAGLPAQHYDFVKPYRGEWSGRKK
jgi:REP element-mobilizing transposase RayT